MPGRRVTQIIAISVVLLMQQYSHRAECPPKKRKSK